MKTELKLFFLLVTAAVFGLNAQSPTYNSMHPATAWKVAGVTLPTTSTAVCGANNGVTVVPCGADVVVNSAVFSNTTSASISVYLTDNSTNCSGAVCQPAPAVSIPAHTVICVPLYGITLAGGVKWYASATGVHAWINGNF